MRPSEIAASMRVLLLAVLLAGCATPTSPPPAENPYADIPDGAIRGLSAQEVGDLLNGTGMRLALPAELNGYPGPRHALDLARELDLTDEQRSRIEALYASMNAEAKGLGREIVDLQTTLEAGFRNGTMDTARLDELGRSIGDRWTDLRLVHLRAHVAMKGILTPHQVALYGDHRGYGSADHTTHAHG